MLEQRGIIDAAVNALWIPQAYKPKGASTFYDGWSYFTHYNDREGAIRWKSGDPECPMKYSWPDRKPAHVKYYLVRPINTDDHTLHVTAGEPDLLVLYGLSQANLLCWFGENSIPSTFPEDCVAWGITTVYYYLDHDTAGVKAAEALVKMVEAYKLEHPDVVLDVKPKWKPDEPIAERDGLDLNKLWIEAEFDKDKFTTVLRSLVVAEDIIKRGTAQAMPQKQAELPTPADEDAYIGKQYDTSHPDEVKEIKRRCVIEVAKHLKKKGSKPDYYVCPFPHDPKDPEKDFILHLPEGPGDDAYISGCCGKHAGAFKNHATLWAKHFNIDVTAIARDVASEMRPDDKPNTYLTSRYKKDGHVEFITSDEAMDNVDDWMEGRNLPDVDLILCPYGPLRTLGGFARLWEPGKAVLIIGPAGMGKTALIERMSDNLRIDGYDDFMVGPEWKPEGYQYRATTRYAKGTISYTAQWEHVQYERQKAKGVENPVFNPLNKALLEEAKKIRQDVRRWPGKSHYPKETNMNNVEHIMDGIGKRALELRDQGRRPAVVWWDYLQMGRGGDDGWYQLEYDMGIIKEYSDYYKLIPVLVSQVNKSVEKAIEDGGGMVNGSDGQGISRAKPNLIVTISPVMENGYRKDLAVLKVSKNNGGKAPAIVTVKTALFRHDWMEEIVPDKQTENAPPPPPIDL